MSKILFPDKSQSYRAETLPLKNNDYIVVESLVLEKVGKVMSYNYFNACHQLVWSRYFKLSISSILRVNKLIETRDSCFIGIYSTNQENFIFKCNFKGEVQWQKNIPNPAKNIMSFDYKGIVEVGSKDFILAGRADSISNGKTIINLFFFKIDEDGNLIWSKKHQFSGGVGFNSDKLMSFDKNNSVFFTTLPKDGILNPVAIAFDSSGKLSWVKKLNLLPGTSFSDAFSDSLRNIFVIGNVNSNGTSHFALKLDNKGAILWLKYTKPAKTSLHSGFEKEKYLTLCFYDYNSTLSVIKYDNKLNEIVGKRYTGHFNSSIYNIRSTLDDGFMLNTYQDGILSIFKGDNQGNISCNQSDTSIIWYNSVATTENFGIVLEQGYKLEDSHLEFIKYKRFSQQFICSSQPIPQAELGEDTVICFGNSLILSAGQQNAGCRIKWSTGDTTLNTMITKSGTYWLQSSYGACSSSDTIQIVFYEQIKSKLKPNYTICKHDSVLLSANADSVISNFYWITPQKDSLDNKIHIYSKSLYARDSGWYYLMLSGVGNCKTIDSSFIDYYALPQASAGPDTLLCYNQEYTMQGKGGVRYQWIPSKYLSNDTLPNAKAKLPISQHYQLVVTNIHGCRDTSEVMLQVKPPLFVELHVNKKEICQRETVAFEALTYGGDSLKNKLFFNGLAVGNNFSTLISKSGYYKIRLEDGCSEPAYDSVYIKVNEIPNAEFEVYPSKTLSTDETFSFINKSKNISKSYWDFGDGNFSNQFSDTHKYDDTGIYEVTLKVWNFSGCSGSNSVLLYVKNAFRVYMPNVFTPDGNRLNEVFEVIGSGISSYELEIYNRWGELLYKDSNRGWDGYYKNLKVQEGIYIYKVTVYDLKKRPHYLKGSFSVLW